MSADFHYWTPNFLLQQFAGRPSFYFEKSWWEDIEHLIGGKHQIRQYIDSTRSKYSAYNQCFASVITHLRTQHTREKQSNCKIYCGLQCYVRFFRQSSSQGNAVNSLQNQVTFISIDNNARNYNCRCCHNIFTHSVPHHGRAFFLIDRKHPFKRSTGKSPSSGPNPFKLLMNCLQVIRCLPPKPELEWRWRSVLSSTTAQTNLWIVSVEDTFYASVKHQN